MAQEFPHAQVRSNPIDMLRPGPLTFISKIRLWALIWLRPQLGMNSRVIKVFSHPNISCEQTSTAQLPVRVRFVYEKSSLIKEILI